MNEPRVPGCGSVFLGVAAAAFATGPCMMSLIGLAAMIDDAHSSGRWTQDFGKLPAIMVYSSLFCLIGSVPAACLNAYALSRAARKAYDFAWVAILSGAVIGIIVLLVLIEIVSGLSRSRGPEFHLTVLLFAATGGCMGLLHWAIALRPRRHWRQRLMHDEEAIRAME